MNKFEIITKSRPHVVILGAGASLACIADGDKNGNRISAMNGFIHNSGLSDIIAGLDLHTKVDNLEEVYIELDDKIKNGYINESYRIKFEEKIKSYLRKFELPDIPTIYDFIILGLTSKDLIATFNWDPLLVQAINRVSQYTSNIPHFAFLHGNIDVGYCKDHHQLGSIGSKCSICNRLLVPTNLLFPIRNKDYTSDPAIKTSWDDLKTAIGKAYLITIFGYSAPKSDIDAISILKDSWGNVKDRNIEEIEIIDIRDEDSVISSWDDFIHTHHYSYVTNFFDSYLAKFPRRTCDAIFDMFMNCKWLNGDKGFKEGMNFDDILKIVNNLIIDENIKSSNEILINPY